MVGIGAGSFASAADMPVKAPVYKAQPAAAYNWTGWYAGGNLGYAWGGATVNGISTIDPLALFVGYDALGGFRYPSLHPSGAVGGFQAGYNWQTSQWVLGLVADFQWTGMKASGTANVPPLAPFSFRDSIPLGRGQMVRNGTRSRWIRVE
jgi:outer membrane immunogenic protein